VSGSERTGHVRSASDKMDVRFAEGLGATVARGSEPGPSPHDQRPGSGVLSSTKASTAQMLAGRDPSCQPEGGSPNQFPSRRVLTDQGASNARRECQVSSIEKQKNGRYRARYRDPNGRTRSVTSVNLALDGLRSSCQSVRPT